MKITDFITESKVLVETRTPNQILMELNVINIPQIDSYLSDIARNLPTKETQKWFTTRAKKYLINSEEDNAVITHLSGKAEPWMKQRQKEGVQMYTFNPSHDLTTKLAHVVDWVRAMNDTTTGAKASDQQSITRAKKALKGLNNTSIAQAFELSNQWVRDMNSGKDDSYKRAEDETGLVPVMVHGEYKWYKLTDQDCLDREGKVMGHCVASYGSDVKSGKTVIYSLRDNNNFAHATVEIQRGELHQVKGKRNAPPVEKYQRATVALLNTLNVPPTRSGLSDIEGMDFMYNKHNHKYGTVQDVGEKWHDQGNITIWSTGGKDVDSLSLRITTGDKIICSIAQGRYNRGLEYNPSNVELMNSIEVKGAKYSDPTYKLAKFITQVIPQSSGTGEIHLKGDLSKYMDTTDGGILKMQEDLGKTIFTDGEDVLQLIQPNQHSIKKIDAEALVHLNKGGVAGSAKYNIEDQNIGDRKTVVGTGWSGINSKSLPILTKYVNTLKAKDRPIIQDDAVFQNPKTFEASTNYSETAEKIAVSKSGNIGWYKIINSSTAQNDNGRRRGRGRFNVSDLNADADKKPEVAYRYVLMNDKQIVVTIGVNEDESKHKFDIYYKDGIRSLDQKQIEEVTDVFNKSGLNKFYPFTDNEVVSIFEAQGLYFLREKRMFTTDHSIAGEQFQHDDKDFKAIKTHNHLNIYYKGAEVVVFDLDNAITSPGIKAFKLKNKLLMLNNARKIADVLNHYDIHRQDQGNYNVSRDTNKKIAQAGLTYSYDNGWKGMKSGPKPTEGLQGEAIRTVGKSEYEIHSFKRDFLIQDAKTHELIATLKGWKEVGDPTLIINTVKMDSQTSSAYDIVADALQELSQKEDISINIRSDSFKYEEEGNKFNDAVRERGYTGTAYGGWNKIADKYPPKIISKGTGGTWVKEAFTKGADPSIRDRKSSIQSSYSRAQDPEDKAIKKYDEYSTSFSDNKYTLYSRKTPVLRVVIKNDALQVVYRITGSEGTAEILHTKEALLKYANPIGRLLHKLEVSGGEYLTDHKLYLVKGKIKDITKNPKLAGFTAGEIVYEDGHKWEQGGSRYRAKEWTLSLTTDEGKKLSLIKATIDGNGIKDISFSDPKVRKYTKLYRPFLNDIMDIVDQLYGSD